MHVPIRTLIVDDEALGREAVRNAIATDARFDIIGECAGGADAIRRIAEEQPQVVFLDIQMPEVDGFDVLEAISDDPPLVVMVTAFDEHAVRAFTYHAVDYVLKPIDADRITQALDHLVERVTNEGSVQTGSGIAGLIESVRHGAAGQQRILLRTLDSMLFLETNELEWLESAGNYVKVHALGATHLIRSTMTAIAADLDTDLFIRIHRSYVVNLHHVRELRPTPGGGDGVIRMRDGAELPIARNHRAHVIEALRGTGS